MFKLFIGINHIKRAGLHHGNINADNVLVNVDLDVKLINFGFGFNYKSVLNG